jgi:glycosyltransferase involved in cell wall biosynthesis
VYAGSVNRSRNIIKFLNGLSNQTDRKVHIHIIGSAPKPVISQLNYQQKDIKIIFHGECEWDNTIEAISESDICILPLNPNVKNYNYSYPIKLFEYLSVGGAVLATSTVGIKQIVTDSKTAMISDDIDTINKRFNLLLKKPEIRRKMSENGTDISRDYMWEDITNEYIVCIENHLDSHKNA